MGLLPVKQKSMPNMKRQLPRDLASLLAAGSSSLGQLQNPSSAAGVAVGTRLNLPAGPTRGASASKLTLLSGPSSQTANLPARLLRD